MKDNYDKIYEAFKYYGGIGPVSGIFSISLNVYTDFMKDCICLVDGNYVKLPDADRTFISVNS